MTTRSKSINQYNVQSTEINANSLCTGHIVIELIANFAKYNVTKHSGLLPLLLKVST